MNAKRVFAAALLVSQAGCMTGPRRVSDMSPKDYLSINAPTELWATMKDGQEIFVGGPRVISDTIFGWSIDGSEELAVPVDSLEELRIRKLSIWRTAIIPTFLVGGIATIWVTTASSGGIPGEFIP